MPEVCQSRHHSGGAHPAAYARDMRDMLAVIKRTLVSFYDDQMTHHAAALTYYALMSLFPTVLFALSLLGLIGQYPETYNAIMGYARDVAPDSVVTPLDSSLQQALQNKGTATTTLAISAVIAFYGTTGVLEAARRALNVVFEIESGRSFLRRKLVDVASTIVLITLALVTGVLVFVGGGFADDLFDFIGLGQTAADIWKHRPLAGGAARRDVRLLLHLLHHPRRPAALVALGDAGRGGRRAAVAAWRRGASRPTSPRCPTSAPSTAPSPARSCSWPGCG